MKSFLNNLLLAAALSGFALETDAQPVAAPPAWAQNVVWYQIFVERFANGDPANDPKPENMKAGSSAAIPADWRTTPWTHNWYEPDAWAKKAGLSYNDNIGLRRFGGDLQGIFNKLDYLQKLGITALYLNPINDAPSLHKYDARSYHHVDVNFGPDPVGDAKLIAAENPGDPATWVWTAADRQFLKLVQEVHRRGMRIILDYSWNHTGTQFWAWQDIVKNQEKSPFREWYDVVTFDNPATPQNEFAYKGWANLASLPEIKKVDVTGARVSGRPYEGTLNPGAKQHVLAVTKRWLAPDGDPKMGIDGYRLDVADQVPMGFWREYHAYVKSVKPEAYLVGEIWWEKWPNKLMDPVPYVDAAGIFDAVMFYQVYKPARSFFAARTTDHIDAGQLRDSLQYQWNRLTPPTRRAMMNVNATHDSPRLLTCFYNPSQYKFKATPHDNPAYKTGRPDAETYQRARLYLLHQFTSVGSPQIWNGEEMGMWGSDDPDCRKPLWWPEFKFEPETRANYQPGPKSYDPVGFNAAHFAYYQQLIKLRKTHPVLASGELEFLTAAGNTLAYRRFDARNPAQQVVVVFNMDSKPLTYKLPKAGAWTNLLTGKAATASVVLPPLSGMALKQ
ncbi:DUF3459 domain-containing protein [Hymenobacter sp. BT683]|uniref:DUF3459 domain-containing protein n=1 Tax=Hymenobacter jeongseonensis TaxID=2791027 RepID=A0ABS0INF2_9BACT|nr:glycoside hydrolase family 13 protein [Hymenobacter jeongseonensis]MBF9239910.1 DUF3459 domain-containing protein [Hymenobacter jeongseonensis]